MEALLLSIAMTDLTTFEGAETPGNVKQLYGKAIQPVPNQYLSLLNNSATDPIQIPSCAAICVYPQMVPKG